MWWRSRWVVLVCLQVTAATAILPYGVLADWTPRTDPRLEAACVVAWTLLALFSVLAARRWSRSGFPVALWLSGMVVAAHTFVSPLQQVQVLNGLQLLVLGILAAFATTAPHVIRWLVASCGLYLLAITVNPAPMGIWLGPVIASLVVATTLMVARMLQDVRDASTHDPLTGALNRHGLRVQARLIRQLDARRAMSTSVAYLDLDGFKQYNDSHGHAAGDAMLVEVVRRLRSLIRSGDLVARVGGDEFVLVLSGTGHGTADEAIDRICAELPIDCSAGVAEWPPGCTLEETLEVVDCLMYEQKKQHHAAAR